MSQKNVRNDHARILICRLSHIGDCILTLPLLRATRAAIPNAWIAWATENPSPQLLNNHPDLDEVITIPKGWMKQPKTVIRLRRELRSRSFDIAIDPQSIAKSALLARISGARTRVGFKGEHGRELSPWFNNKTRKPKSSHLVDRSLELLEELDISLPETPQFVLPIRDTAHCYIDHFVSESDLSGHRFTVINPGASWPSKRWEDERFGEVAARLFEQSQVVSVVSWAGQKELEMAMSICRASNGSAILAPKTDLQQLAALLMRADLFVGCDTGPLHLAAAVDTTCVGLYGPTRPQDSGAYGTKHFAIQNQYQAGTSRQRRGGINHAMKSITTTQVVDACCRALAATRVAEPQNNDRGSQAA